MPYITEKSEFEGDDVPLLDTTTPVMGYDGTSIGPANAQAQVLANRTMWLKEESQKTNETVGGLTDTTEKIKLKQTSIGKQLTSLTEKVTSVDEDLSEKIKALDERETNDFQALTIGLGQATTDIATNGQSIRDLQSGLEEANNAQLKLEDSVEQVQTTVADQKKDIDTLKTAKQDKLQSGTNINTVMGVSLLDLREEGITLDDADDFAEVLKKRLSVGKGLTLQSAEDAASLILSVVKEENLGSNLIIQAATVTGGRLTEFKQKLRPTYNLRAFVFKSESVTAQSTLTVNFITDPSNQATSEYTGEGTMNRISIVPDTTTTRWSTLKTLKIDNNLYPNTKMAISPDSEGKTWYTYSAEENQWVELGELKVDTASADILVEKGITVKDFAALDISITAKWLSEQEDVPWLNVAFAASVDSATQVFVPAKMVATFNAADGWTMQSPYFSPVYITRDSIIFKPSSSGNYIFCYEFQK